jgi:hypothetical protein
MRKALKFPEDLIPIGDGLEEGSLFKAEDIQKKASSLTTFMPCGTVHIGQSYLVGTTQKCRSLSNLKNFNLCAVVVNISSQNDISPAILAFMDRL